MHAARSELRADSARRPSCRSLLTSPAAESTRWRCSDANCSLARVPCDPFMWGWPAVCAPLPAVLCESVLLHPFLRAFYRLLSGPRCAAVAAPSLLFQSQLRRSLAVASPARTAASSTSLPAAAAASAHSRRPRCTVPSVFNAGAGIRWRADRAPQPTPPVFPGPGFACRARSLPPP